jgi:hypothetical protein
MVDWQTPFEEIPVGKGRKVSDGNEIALVTIGHVGEFCSRSHFRIRYVFCSSLRYAICEAFGRSLTTRSL